MQAEMEIDKPAFIIDLPVYQYVRDAQLQHGLKYDDHRQYRSYCSRRIHRIRRSLNVIQGIAPSAKARHTRARKLTDISNAMVLEAGDKNNEYAERMLVIPLFLAERAWSYAMQLKQEVSECPRKRFHLLRKINKAAGHATKFQQLVNDPESPCSERTKKEATAYDAYMDAIYNLELGYWDCARGHFHTSLVLYTTLSLSITNKTFIEQYRLRIEEIRASYRYCSFSIGKKPAVNKIELPANLKFNDIAFRHVRHLQEQESEQIMPVAQVPSYKDEVAAPTISKSPSKPSSAKPVAAAVKEKTATKTPAQSSPSAEEDEEDEFEETREAMEEAQSEEEEESETESDDDEQQKSGGGGVTGLVKGWLGGAWS